jgi:hypothetical protein
MATSNDPRRADDRAATTGEHVREDGYTGDRVDDRHDRDHDGVDDRVERGRGAGSGATAGAAVAGSRRDRHDRDHDGRDDRLERGERRPVRDAAVLDHEAARERFGGVNWGAAFFGWLVAIGMTALLTGIIAVVATAVGYSNGVTTTDAQRAAGTVTAVTAAVLLAVLLVAYYSGGYVAGRMSRFDGGKQGLAVWVVGLLVTLVAAVLGWVAGDQYNLLDRVNVPRIPIPTQDVTVGGIVVVVLVLLVTLLAAMLGGKVGRRYHARVDRSALVDTTTY